LSTFDKWYNILRLIPTEARVIGLIALIADVVVLATIPILPPEQRIYGFSVFALLLLGTLIGAVVIVMRSRSQDHDQPSFSAKVRSLKEQLFDNGFLPALIIAIPRGGLVVAGILARQLGEQKIVPVISLCRLQERGFDNPFNQFKVRSKGS
jgi:phosphoribosyl transferase-like protein